MAEFEDKFFVINRKHLKRIPPFVRPIIREAMRHIPDNKYYVCNQDEPYAQDVIQTILKGEECKEAKEQYAQKKEALDSPTSLCDGLPF